MKNLKAEIDQTTGWFPPEIEPARKGVYQRPGVVAKDRIFFSYFDGRFWHGLWGSPAQAFSMNHLWQPSAHQVPWRGLAQKP